MARPDLRIMPLPEGEEYSSQDSRDKARNEELSRLLAANQETFVNKGFNLFGDRKMLEVAYRHFLDVFAGDDSLNPASVALESGESELKVVVALDVFKSILGSPDDRPAGGAAGGLAEDYEEADTQNKRAA